MATITFKRFFIENPLPSSRITLNGVGYKEKMTAGTVFRPKGTGDYLFMLFYDPVYIGNSRKADMFHTGHFVIWPPGHGQYYGNPQREYTHTWIHCQGPCIETMIDRAGIPLSVPGPVSNPALFEDTVERIHQEALRAESDPVIVRNLLENWIRYAARDRSERPQAEPIPEWLMHIRSLLEANYTERITLADLAAEASKSIPHLSSEFKKHFDCAPVEYLIRLRMREAVHLLPDINLNITQIAERVGYEDIYHFSRLFKRHCGLSPMAMRKRCLAPQKRVKSEER